VTPPVITPPTDETPYDTTPDEPQQEPTIPQASQEPILAATSPSLQRSHANLPQHSDMVKQPNRLDVNVGDAVEWRLRDFHSRSGGAVTNFSIIDMPGRGLNFVSGTIPAFTNGEGVTFVIRYAVYGSDVWHIYASGLDASMPHSFQLPQSGDVWYTNIEFYFGNVPAGFAVGNEIVLTFMAGDDAPEGVLNNRFIVGYNGTHHEGINYASPVVRGSVGNQPADTQQAGLDNFNPQTSDNFNGTVFIVFASGAVLSLGALMAIIIRRKRTTH